MHRVENAPNRIVLGVILAALVIAVGFVVSVYRPGAQGGLVGIFLASGFGAGAVVVARLVWLATRNRRTEVGGGLVRSAGRTAEVHHRVAPSIRGLICSGRVSSVGSSIRFKNWC